MTTVKYQEINPNLLSYSDFNLAVKNSHRKILITMFMIESHFYTKSLPKTYEILQNNLPQVLNALCFNDSDLPFDVEVKNTEIGHLFEHILLEYMCEEKIKKGFSKASFKGVTNWDWKRDNQGTFHIQIEIEPEDVEFFELALEKSIVLFNLILFSQKESASRLIN